MPSGNPSFGANQTRSTGGASQAGASRPAGSSQVGSQGMGGNTSGQVGGAPAGGGSYGGSIGSNSGGQQSGNNNFDSGGSGRGPDRGGSNSFGGPAGSTDRQGNNLIGQPTYSGPKGVPSQGLNKAAQQAAQNARDTSRLATAKRQRAAGRGLSRPSLAGKVADLRNAGMALTNRELAAVQNTARRVWDGRTPGGGQSVHTKQAPAVNRAKKGNNFGVGQRVNPNKQNFSPNMLGTPSSNISAKSSMLKTNRQPAPQVSNVAAKANRAPGPVAAAPRQSAPSAPAARPSAPPSSPMARAARSASRNPVGRGRSGSFAPGKLIWIRDSNGNRRVRVGQTS